MIMCSRLDNFLSKSIWIFPICKIVSHFYFPKFFNFYIRIFKSSKNIKTVAKYIDHFLDVVQPRILAGSCRPLIFLYIGGWFSIYSFFLANHCVCSLENAFSQFIIYSDKSSSVSILFISDLIKTISCAVKE
jgi:hypothetical protein